MPTNKKKPAEPEHCTGTRIEGCHFVGVQWDAKAVEAVVMVARGLEAQAVANAANSKALDKLAEVFRASNVHMEAMMKIDGAH